MRKLVLLVVPFVAACAAHQRPQAPTPAPAAEIAASQARTWDAVVDLFTERNLQIRTMERASGFVSTDRMVVDDRGVTAWADCGRVFGSALRADRATYSVIVRGDSVRSTARVSVRWTQGGHSPDDGLVECATRGTWEAELQAAIKARAEQRATGG